MPKRREIVEVIQPGLAPGAKWAPVVGSETAALLKRLEEKICPDERKTLLNEAVAILAKSVPVAQRTGRETGLVVGYVQGGKTVAYTTLLALARDNGFRLIIVITGTGKHLYEQNAHDRLAADLKVDSRRWKHVSTADLSNEDTLKEVEHSLQEWKSLDPSVCRTVLITVLKHYTHLDNLISLLSDLDLNGVPAIIVDDEADEAGLNTMVNEGDESPTYRRLKQVKDCIPAHTYLEVTATPQAPLLLTIIDVLSPSFAAVLTPGADYVGGKEFFIENDHLIRDIPDEDIPSDSTILKVPDMDAPASLKEAMRLFILGVSAGHLLDGAEGNRSMLVHPSERTHKHGLYTKWVTSLKEAWLETLKLPASNRDRNALVAEFRPAYYDLDKTARNLPPFEDLIAKLPMALGRTIVREVNSTGRNARRQKPPVNWKSEYAFILIGGKAMDRGFTVEGLTVTYMPRGKGVGNVDTIQQRGRFFGYKRPYLGYCRIFLEPAVRAVFRKYVDHEEDVRARLLEHNKKGLPMKQFKRAFFLERGLRPTRPCVLSLEHIHKSNAKKWIWPTEPHVDQRSIAANNDVIESFLATCDAELMPGHADRTPSHKHRVSRVPLRKALDELLVPLNLKWPLDAMNHMLALMQIDEYLLRHPDAACAIYEIAAASRGPRKRMLTNGRITSLMAGAYPRQPEKGFRRGEIYPGDEAVYDPKLVSIQIHRLDQLVDEEENVVQNDVHVVAIRTPEAMARYGLIQEPGPLPQFVKKPTRRPKKQTKV